MSNQHTTKKIAISKVLLPCKHDLSIRCGVFGLNCATCQGIPQPWGIAAVNPHGKSSKVYEMMMEKAYGRGLIPQVGEKR
jgi:hypothetical protein